MNDYDNAKEVTELVRVPCENNRNAPKCCCGRPAAEHGEAAKARRCQFCYDFEQFAKIQAAK